MNRRNCCAMFSLFASALKALYRGAEGTTEAVGAAVLADSGDAQASACKSAPAGIPLEPSFRALLESGAVTAEDIALFRAAQQRALLDPVRNDYVRVLQIQ